MSLPQLKVLMDEEKFTEAIQLAETLIGKDAVKNKAAFLFLAQAQVELGMTQDAQNALNSLYANLQLGANKNDDMLYMKALTTNQKIAVKMQNEPNASKKVREAGRELQKQNQFKIIEFFEMKQKYDKMLEEVETFMTILQEDERFKDVEDNLNWLINHAGVPDELKIGFAARIHDIDQFYNPYTKIEKVFSIVMNLQGKQPPYSDAVVNVAQKVLNFLERQNWKKDLHSAVNQLNASKNMVEEFTRYSKSAVPAAEIVFMSNPSHVLFGGEQAAVQHFVRAICFNTYSLAHGSEEWQTFIAGLEKVTKMEVFTATIGDLESNPCQLIISAILDINHILTTFEFPDQDQGKELFFVKHFADREDGHEILMNFSKQYKGLSPFINQYVTLCSTCLGWAGSKVPIETAVTMLNLATYLQRSTYKNRLGPKNQPADSQVISSILNVRLAQFLEAEKRSATIENVNKTMEAIQKFASPEIMTVYMNEQSQIQWKLHLQSGKWQDAILELQRVAESSPAKAPWVNVRVAWIKFSFLDRIAKDQDEKKLILQNTFAQLQEASTANDKDAEPLLMQGTMLFLKGADIGPAGADSKACLSKWLLALKRDQTNADTFYCLALYYLCREKNMAKAQRCLDKALLLRPDFEEAFLLNYCMLNQEGKPEAAFALVGKMQTVNRNVASTYYLNALSQLREGNYIQAIDDLQNATRFYSISRSQSDQNKNNLRAIYPLPKEFMEEHSFTLMKAKLGLLGSHEKQFVAVWVHLIQCFVKIDKPLVAQKCFIRAMQEFETIFGSHLGDLSEAVTDSEMQTYVSGLVTQVEKMRQADRFKMIESPDVAFEAVVKTLGKINQVLDASKGGAPVPLILIECIECLTMGAQITTDQNLSIELALTGLKISNRFNIKNQLNVVETLSSIIISRFTDKIQHSSLLLFGKSTVPIWVKNQLTLLEEMIVMCDQKLTSQATQQASIHALYTMSYKSDDLDKEKTLLLNCFKRVEALISNLQISPDSQTIFGPFARSLLLDAAKIALKCELVGISDNGIVQKKLKYAKWALMLDPENAELWVHLHLCLTSDSVEDKAMRGKAIFKAYELDPELPFVQEHLLKHYLSSPKTYSRAFHMILRTTQQQQADPVQAQQQTTLPIITAALAFLNARSYFSGDELQQRRDDRKSQLLQAINLINLIEQRDDLIVMFQSLQVFLQHQRGDYLQTIKYLEHLCSDDQDGCDLLKLLLIEAYFGTTIHDFNSLMMKFEETSTTVDGAKFGPLLEKSVSMLSMPSNDSSAKGHAEALMTKFKANPREVASYLILVQEMCLAQNILPDTNVLDLDEQIMESIEKLDLPDQRILIIQSLIFCQIRDGEIATNSRIKDGQTGEFTEEEKKDANSQGKDYLKYLIKASRIKPRMIDSISTHKDLLSAKLQSLKNPQMYLGEPIKMPENPKDRTYIGLEQLIKVKQQKLLFAQKELMKDPSSLKANVAFIWGLIYNSRIPDALKAYNVLQRKMQTLLIMMTEASDADTESLEQINQVLNQQEAQGATAVGKTIQRLCSESKLANESTDPEEYVYQMIERIAVGLVKAILSTSRTKKQGQLFSELSFLLQSLVLQRGQHNIFIKLVERMLSIAVSLPKSHAQVEMVNLLWGYKCLNKTSALFQLKKNASSTQEANMAVKVLRSGMVIREPIPGILLQARSYQLVRNDNQAANALEQTSDDPSIVRDIIIALGYFAQQAYKQFYLTSLGLVAGCKTQVERMKDIVLGEAKQQAYYSMAYAYYLKAFAECTFLAARRQNITLQEDFDTEEDGQTYDQEFFKCKARTSLAKASRACWHARDLTGELKSAIDFMLTQTTDE